MLREQYLMNHASNQIASFTKHSLHRDATSCTRSKNWPYCRANHWGKLMRGQEKLRERAWQGFYERLGSFWVWARGLSCHQRTNIQIARLFSWALARKSKLQLFQCTCLRLWAGWRWGKLVQGLVRQFERAWCGHLDRYAAFGCERVPPLFNIKVQRHIALWCWSTMSFQQHFKHAFCWN